MRMMTRLASRFQCTSVPLDSHEQTRGKWLVPVVTLAGFRCVCIALSLARLRFAAPFEPTAKMDGRRNFLREAKSPR